MSWPCPDCNSPFTFGHCCPELRKRLAEPNSKATWAFLAHALNQDLKIARAAFRVELSLRVKEHSGVGTLPPV